jgi:predicted MFS family arabinose efflux permease
MLDRTPVRGMGGRLEAAAGGSMPDEGSRAPGPISKRYANYALAALFVVYVFNFLDRQLLNLFIVPIQQELGVSDTRMGLLTGLSFALFYAIAGLPLARWADRNSRTTLIAAGLVVWSGMTAVTGLARSYVHLLLARIGVGIGEASFTPAGHSLIADLFPPERRSSAMAIFAAGASFGTIVGYIGGAFIYEALGWRSTFAILGLAGIPIALVFRLTMREPARTGLTGAQTDAPPLAQVLRALVSRRALVFLAISASMHGFSSYGSGTWTSVFLIRVHELSVRDAGIILGLGSGIGATLGQIVAGRVADHFGSRNVRWYTIQPAITSLVSLPLFIAFLWSWDFFSALVLYILAAAISSAWTGPTYALTQSLAPARMRATASAIVVFLLNLVGMGLGPLFVGALNDWLGPSLGPSAIRYSLMFAAVPHAIAALFNLLAARTLETDLASAAADSG